jgi:hypothetical protein
MRFGGVRRFEISRSDPLPSWDFPFFASLSYFSRMHSVSILNPTLLVLRRGWMILNHMPPSITSLALVLPIDFGSWLCMDKYDPRVISKVFGEKGHKHEVATRTSYPTYNVAKNMPNLTHLCISTIPHRSDMFSSLTNWSTTSRHTAVETFFKSCPPTLTTVQFPHCSPDFRRLNFPQLDHIGVEYASRSLELDTRTWELLPSTLSRIDLSIMDATIQTFEGLPGSLRTFNMVLKKREWRDKYLKGLGDLMITHMSLELFTGVISENFFSMLPKSLISFELDCRYCPPLQYSHLPQSLTKLVFNVEEPGDSFWTVCFPPTLVHLELKYNWILSYEDILVFPRGLTYLSLNLKLPRHNRLQSNCSTALPETLKSLKISSSDLFQDFLDTLPSELTSLDFVTTAFLGPNALRSLPPTLIKLAIECKGGITEEALGALPSGLQDLTVTNGEKISNRIISLLPPSMLHLSIINNCLLDDHSIVELPRGLISLRLPQNTKLTVACAAHLPKSLYTLQVRSILMTSPPPPKAELMQSFPHWLPVYELPWLTKRGKKFNLVGLRS